MAINAIAVAQTTPESAGGTAPTNQLGKQEFLQLLVAQLRNQDPLRPMEDREFIAQLAQLSTMETMQRMQVTLESLLGAQLLGHAMSLLGHQIVATRPDGQTFEGTVQGVQRAGADILLDLGDGGVVHLADVQSVYTSASGDTTVPDDTTAPEDTTIPEGGETS